MDNFLNEMLGGDGCREARERFRALWDEYEARETPESKLVKVGTSLYLTPRSRWVFTADLRKGPRPDGIGFTGSRV
jgi:hypothetical protein